MTRSIRKIAGFAAIVFNVLHAMPASAQTVVKGAEAEKKVPGAELVSTNSSSNIPSHVQFKKGSEKDYAAFNTWFHGVLALPENVSLKLISTEKDKLGMSHYRYQQTVNGFPVEGSMYIVHVKNNKVISMNGMLSDKLNSVSAAAALPEKTALQHALNHVKADVYRWQSAEQEKQLKQTTGKPDATWYPKGELMVAAVKGDHASGDYRLVYRFDIYANKPLKRSYVFVDANTGEIVHEQNRIVDVNVPATAYTVYSGHRIMMTDSTGPGAYRLHETGRGNGIITYNNLSAANPTGTTDFTNATTTWNNVNAKLDQYATDAHWGAEKTYDFFDSIMGRNSIDDAGYQLVSYVHVDVGLVNAFWDGSTMNYGDGNATHTPLTTLDITGHEISHGLTQFTSALGTNEAGAMNEGFSDCMGTYIRYYARHATTYDWKIGDEIGGAPFRDMANPKSTNNPDTYKGTNWDSLNQEVHKNSTIFSHSYYLLAVGGSGTNDKGSVYNVPALGLSKAAQIWYRMNTVYLYPTASYFDARTFAIQAASDLYGACSPEVVATTNAWYAVGVGNVFSPAVTASFTSTYTNGCVLPFNVDFTNTSVNSTNAVWHFGDGTISTTFTPSHTYTSAGTYNVKLAVSSTCGADSVVQSNYITITLPPAPSVTPAYSCTSPAAVTLNASGGGALSWYTSPAGGAPVHTGAAYTTPSLSSTTTYYVESHATGATGKVGSTVDASVGGMHNNSSYQYLVFDVLQGCTLQTVVVNSGAAGTRNIILWDNKSNILQNIPVNFASGISTVSLNIHLNPGKAYQIGGTGMNLWRNNSGATYPYSLNGVLNITGSSAGTSFYYYFYNWQVQADPCISSRIPVIANIGGPAVTYSSAAYDTLCTTDASVVLTGGAPAGGTYSGSGVSAGSFNPATGGSGDHKITYSYTDANNCTNSVDQNIYVKVCVTGIHSNDPSSAMIIYPNPTSGSFTMELGLTNDEKTELKIINTLGQTIKQEEHNFISGNNKISVDLSSFANGIYFIELKTPSNVLVRRITKS